MVEFNASLLSGDSLVWANGLLVSWWQYVTESSGNSIAHLGWVVALAFGWFLIRLYQRKRAARQARASIPLVIGGAGSRGKSGTERCKAAVLHGFGAQVLCKTTGARASLLHTFVNQRPVEYPEFRPGEYPSVEEQIRVMKTASGLGCQVLLYEAMALTPRYLEIFQDHWMRDDYSTLTNTLPDHEELQGPAGFNVAESLAGFLPRNTQAWTAEHQMFPILEECAKRKGTRLNAVGFRAAEMLPPDVLEQFPYPEHPENIALVLALTKELGLDEGFVLREMAENLVPDFGSLQTFPRVRVGARIVSFSNVMSANGARDSLDALGRMKALRMDSREHSGAWLVMLLNNRADRLTREKTFASLIARRLPAHAIVLCGDNVQRLMEEVDRELIKHSGQWDITGETQVSNLRSRLRKDFERLGIICRQEGDLERVTARIMGACGILGAVTEVMFRNPSWIEMAKAALQVRGIRSERESEALQGAWDEASIGLDALLENNWKTIKKEDCFAHDWIESAEGLVFIGRFWMQLRATSSMSKEIFDCLAKEPIPEGLSTIYSEYMSQILRSRMFPVDTAIIDEEEVMRRVIQEAPPGFRVHICGLQNMKGFGNKMVQLWLGVKEARGLVDRLDSPEAKVRNEAFKEVRDRSEYRFFEALAALHGLRQYQNRAQNPDSMIQSEIPDLIKNIEKILVRMEELQFGASSSWVSRNMAGVWRAVSLVPVSLWRALKYRRIMDDLKHQRISRKRAAFELKFGKKGG